jgi:hypothetical protein
MSREIDELERLERSLAVYRRVFGQLRQEDLVAWLSDQDLPCRRDSAGPAGHREAELARARVRLRAGRLAEGEGAR